MLDKFITFCRKQNLFSADEKILLAVSGGVDSMVMLHLMHEAKIDVGVAHCNFQLRGEESDCDESLVRKIALGLGVQYYTERFNTKAYSHENGINIQQSARKLRYSWFDKLLKSEGFDRVATAHHASDQTETILYNIIKGCGISGLRGIPVINSKVVRPLLFASRSEILDYAKQKKITWREDKSNADNKYSRNFIRNSIIPELKLINPGIDRTMLRNSERYRAIEALLAEKKEEIVSGYLSAEEFGQTLSLDWLEETKGSFVLLEEILKDYSFNNDQVTSIYESPNQQTGKTYTSSKFKLVVNRGKIHIYPNVKESFLDLEVKNFDDKIELIGTELSFKKVLRDEFQIINDSHVACLDFDSLKRPLKIRSWKSGDNFIPLGMTHKKKLSDFMIDQKIPLNLKKRVHLLESAGQIAWIIGHRIDDRFKVTKKTQNILVVESKKC
ncbi:MAG: tRNA(Ile)-lysidine synthase [Cyclobacteriaceae bacterium]|jgi:tRNA(Ile)-lysidine synthase